eukprot:CAMPEP_0194254364 /NCGR_PEP_ID=MMETSP0158-20130606/31981_1 /TAXON_ID=33649 /ORGANISM="Thalassionema nitzschioides, Strain L26-B" /LENGTH=414 /DNA_ID=CAMNT_0038992365 /DNA_START=49 /DNA_END=1293 /DNA_ORIENTATION=+
MRLLLILLIPAIVLSATRRERFPSVEERVRLYASNWYHPPCDYGSTFTFGGPVVDPPTFQISNTTFGSDVIPDQTFLLTKDIIEDCARDEEDNATLPTSQHIQFRHNMRMYCVDALEILDLASNHLSSSDIPLLIQFGDMKTSHIYGIVELPHFKKFRSASVSSESLANAASSCGRDPLNTVHSKDIMQPIVWKLATHRHYRQLPFVYQHDTPWNKKRDVAIFRGQLTGALSVYDKHDSDTVNCKKMRRCRLVFQTNSSQIIDAKLTTTRNRLPAVIEGVQLISNSVSIREIMRHKAIIMLEGNDVASGLKWALLSQSVVLMPPPKHTSWCMEELLEPWVHYIPLKEDASDIETQMQWVLDNDEKAQQISLRGTLWMEDLIFHPDAAREETLIKEELLRRYFAHFTKLNEKTKL